LHWSEELSAPENRRVIPGDLPRGICSYSNRTRRGLDTRSPAVCPSGMDADPSKDAGDFERFRNLPPFREGAKFAINTTLLPGHTLDGSARWRGTPLDPTLIDHGDVGPAAGVFAGIVLQIRQQNPAAPAVVAERTSAGLRVHTVPASNSPAPVPPSRPAEAETPATGSSTYDPVTRSTRTVQPDGRTVISEALNAPEVEGDQPSDPVADTADDEEVADLEPCSTQTSPATPRVVGPMGGADLPAAPLPAASSTTEERVLQQVAVVNQHSPPQSDSGDDAGLKRGRASPETSARNVRRRSESLPARVGPATVGHFQRNHEDLGISATVASVLDEAFDVHVDHPFRRMEGYDPAALERAMTDDWPHLDEEAIAGACIGTHYPLNRRPPGSRRRGRAEPPNRRGTTARKAPPRGRRS